MHIKSTIVVLGGGAMGGAMARQWSESKVAAVRVVERDPVRRSAISASGILCAADFSDIDIEKSIIVLAIKPQQLPALDGAVKEQLAKCRMLISIMAGVTFDQLKKLSPNVARVMPNLPAQIGRSMSVAYGPDLDATRKEALSILFDHLGAFAWVEDENLLHPVTAVSGSGPAYLFAFMEALEKAATAQGIDAKLAHRLVLETIRGAVQLAAQSDVSISTLRQQVTSPGGTTEAALACFEKLGLENIVKVAVEAASKRSKELAN